MTLEKFSSRIESCRVTLNWKTATEINSKEFVIERSADGITYQAAGVVNASNHPDGSSYTYHDAALAAGTYYYRLKMVDLDGKYEYSNTLQAKINCGSGLISFYPNPAYDVVTVKGIQPNDAVTITDMSGKTAIKVSSTGNSLSIDISSLAKGVYVISVENNSVVSKFIKL